MPDHNPGRLDHEGNLPLSKLTVLDLTRARAGPTAVRHLADWGARIIRIEVPVTDTEDFIGSRGSTDFQNLHRNKEMLGLDLKTPEGHAVFMRLVEQADVVIENMRPDVKNRLKVAWEDVHAVNPRIVYGSISGFGQDGPYAGRAGVDQIAQGMGGLMSVTGRPGQGPMRAGVAIADLTAGNILALAVMMALYERTHTGKGRWVQTSLLEVQMFMLDFQAARYLTDGEVAEQAGNDHPTHTPTGVFETSDGHINIAAASNRFWKRLADLLDKPEWKLKEEWQTDTGRFAQREAINAAINAVTRTNSTAHWVELMSAASIPCGPIYAIDQMFQDPQVQHLGMKQPVAHPERGGMVLVGSPIKMSGSARERWWFADVVGADSDALLAEAGYSTAQISGLRASGIIC